MGKRGSVSAGSAVIIVGLIVLVLIFSGVIPTQLTTTQPQYTPPATPTVGGVTTEGDFDATPSIVNHFTPSTTYTVGTEVAFKYYASVASYKYLGSGTDTITLTKDYGGYVYIAAVPAANYYVHWSDVKLYNSRVEQVLYFDIDGNNIKEFVFKYNCRDIPAKEGYRPKLPFVAYIVPYEAPTLTGPGSSTTSAGTTAVDKYIQWYTSQSNTNRGWALQKLDIVIISTGSTYAPTTDVAKFVYVKIDLPDDGKGYIDLTSSLSIRQNDLYYSCKFGDGLDTALYILTPQTELNRKDFTTNIKMDFESGDPVYQITLTLYYMAPIASGDSSLTTSANAVYYSD